MCSYIMLGTVHTALRRTQRQGTGLGTIGLLTHFPIPIPGPVTCPVQCVEAIMCVGGGGGGRGELVQIQ